MQRPNRLRLARWTAAVLAAGVAGCANVPSIADLSPFSGRSGGDSPEVESRVEAGRPTVRAQNDFAAGWRTPPPAEGTPVLYGRDGSPVGSAQSGVVKETAEPLNAGLDGSGGSRMVILDLYNQVQEERDLLVEENERLRRELSGVQGHGSGLEHKLESLQLAFDKQSADRAELEQQQFEMAGRLAHAQIARLEAERALLEATLRWQRIQEAAEGDMNARSAMGR